MKTYSRTIGNKRHEMKIEIFKNLEGKEISCIMLDEVFIIRGCGHSINYNYNEIQMCSTWLDPSVAPEVINDLIALINKNKPNPLEERGQLSMF